MSARSVRIRPLVTGAAVVLSVTALVACTRGSGSGPAATPSRPSSSAAASGSASPPAATPTSSPPGAPSGSGAAGGTARPTTPDGSVRPLPGDRMPHWKPDRSLPMSTAQVETVPPTTIPRPQPAHATAP